MKYRGPLNYQHFQIVGWACIVAAVAAAIISLGGKAASSVSSKTDYLINNDVTSTSSKNKKARELGIPILSEEDFLAMISET